MKDEMISDKQGISIIALFILGTAAVLNIGKDALQDAWLAIIFSMFLSFPMISIYAYIHHLFPNKNFFTISEIVLGNFLGRIIIIIYILFSFHLGSLILRNVGEFIITVSIPETPMAIPIVFLLSLCIWILKCERNVLYKFSEVGLVVVVPIVIIGILSLISQYDYNNIKPILSDGLKPVFKASFSIFSFPFGELVLFLSIFSCFKNSKSPYRIYIGGLLLGGLLLSLIILLVLLTIGSREFTTSYFPTFASLTRSNIGDFIKRNEVLVAFGYIINVFIKFNICLLACSLGLSHLFSYDDYRFLLTPLAILMLILSQFIYSDISEMFKWAYEIWPFYAFPFQVIFPCLILIIALIKKHKFNKI